MSFGDKLSKILLRYEELGSKLSSGVVDKDFVENSKEYSNLENIVGNIKKYFSLNDELESTKEMLAEEKDIEMKNLLEEEFYDLKKKLSNLEHEIKLELLPKDSADDKNVIVEIRAGTGGDEASLFAADLFNMYCRFAEKQNWKCELLHSSELDGGGYKEISMSILGKGVYSQLKFESGVHRVQRIPKTESSGRIHTSAATVAVLPEAEDIDINIDDKDIRIDTYRSSGAGGQHVNTTDSAVRVTHIPTGVVVCQQDEKSQHKNKAKALKILRARIYDLERQQQESDRANERKMQVGSGDRSQRIRTYNFPQGRITDHRINLTLHKLEEILFDGEMKHVIDPLITENQIKILESCSEF